MSHCAGCVCEVKNEGVEDPMGEYALELEASNDKLRAALERTAILPEFGGPDQLCIARRCLMCGSGAVPGEPIPHTDECALSSANDPQNYPHPETQVHAEGGD